MFRAYCVCSPIHGYGTEYKDIYAVMREKVAGVTTHRQKRIDLATNLLRRQLATQPLRDAEHYQELSSRTDHLFNSLFFYYHIRLHEKTGKQFGHRVVSGDLYYGFIFS